jgi:hypothetical protein
MIICIIIKLKKFRMNSLSVFSSQNLWCLPYWRKYMIVLFSSVACFYLILKTKTKELLILKIWTVFLFSSCYSVCKLRIKGKNLIQWVISCQLDSCHWHEIIHWMRWEATFLSLHHQESFIFSFLHMIHLKYNQAWYIPQTFMTFYFWSHIRLNSQEDKLIAL